MSTSTKRQYCTGCRDDFYNGQNAIGVKECWHLKTAKVVKRWRIGWWTPQDKAEHFRRVTTLDCHNAPGQYAQYAALPTHLVPLKRRASTVASSPAEERAP